jgi:hypothetical protein
MDCTYRPNDVVPIIGNSPSLLLWLDFIMSLSPVGCALADLVLMVLIAYLVGNIQFLEFSLSPPVLLSSSPPVLLSSSPPVLLSSWNGVGPHVKNLFPHYDIAVWPILLNSSPTSQPKWAQLAE